jgi:3-methyladenine DNA glycosylase AlkC
LESLKHLLGPAVVRAAADHLRQAAPAFDRARFLGLALEGLEALEFKARSDHIASALQASLPSEFARAANWLEAALAPPHPIDDPVPIHPGTQGIAGWFLWPMGEYVAREGLAEPERALTALHAFTQRFTAEFAIRPFIQTHPDLVFRTLATWVHDPSAQVRRLVSEGSRPRLPWGLQLKALIRDPSPTLPLLEALQDDASESVRRSVANHLNDIAKDHPGLIADWLARHLPDATEPRRALLRHASRTLIKQGDAHVLGLWGLGGRFKGEATLRIRPKRVVLGGAIELTLELQAGGRATQALEIDYRVHHVKADGSTSPKVFKGWRLNLAGGEARTLVKRHAIKPITTRRYHAGLHRIEVQINGRVVAEDAFHLSLPST